jgi:hypothetical protein
MEFSLGYIGHKRGRTKDGIHVLTLSTRIHRHAYLGVTLGSPTRAARASSDMGGVTGCDRCRVSIGSRAYTAAWSSFAAGIDSPTISAAL